MRDDVVMVMLRQPQSKSRNPNEKRTDPLWEFGSFGCTRCHSRNLMNPRKSRELSGCHLAFAQGGDSGTRLVHVTPPVEMIDHGEFIEAKWSPVEMPLVYKSAPLLVDNNGNSDVPMLFREINNCRRPTQVSRFTSKFRSRRKPLPTDIGCQVVSVYRDFRGQGAPVARSYVDALPFSPPCIDLNRERTYEDLRQSFHR